MKKIVNYLFENNLIYILVLGLCPAIISTTTFENSFIMGLIILLILFINSIIFSVFKNIIKDEFKLPTYIIITSIIVMLIELFLSINLASLYEIYKFTLPLLVINTILLNNMLSFNKEDKILVSIKDNLKIGLTFLIIISLFGLIRELLSTGTITLMNNISTITGYKEIIHVFNTSNKLFMTSGGIFILLGILLGLINNLKRGDNK